MNVEIKECGTLWEFDSKNNIFNLEKQNNLSESIQKISDIVIESILVLFNNVHSIYIGGSSIKFDANPENIPDLDFIVVSDDIYKQHLKWINDGQSILVTKDYERCFIETKIKEILNFEVYLDINFFSKEKFLKNSETNFFYKKIFGNEDLSSQYLNIDHINPIDVKDFYVFEQDILSEIYKFRRIMLLNIKIEKSIRNHIVENCVKRVFRYYFKYITFEKKVYSRDLYYCYKFLSEKYPEFSIDMRTILEMTLNLEKYSDEEIWNVLVKLMNIIWNINQIY